MIPGCKRMIPTLVRESESPGLTARFDPSYSDRHQSLASFDAVKPKWTPD